MQYKGLEIIAFEQTPGQWRVRIVAPNGRRLKGDDRQLLESVTSATAVDTLALVMEAIDATGAFFRNDDRRKGRLLLRTNETRGGSAPRPAKKKPQRDGYAKVFE